MAFVFVAVEHSGEQRTSVQRPPPPPCGRPCGTEEGRQAAGPQPAGSTLAFCQSASGGNNHERKRPATGRWRTSMWSGPDGLPPGRDGRGVPIRGPWQNRDRRGNARLARVFLNRGREDCTPIFLLAAWALRGGYSPAWIASIKCSNRSSNSLGEGRYLFISLGRDFVTS